MALELYKHNQTAYDKLVEMLKTSHYATINHATGTGKSFIILKLLYDNPNKKFLYLTPTYEIINQLLERDIGKAGLTEDDIHVDAMIYSSLLMGKVDIEELYKKYDGFILDEYHRAGAPLTYKKILQLKKLIDAGSIEKKMIGLTATPTRYLDNKRNMTDELFEGNSASEITTAEAIFQNILPMPIYIVASNKLEEEYDKAKRKIQRLAPSQIKTQLQSQLSELEPEEVIGFQKKVIEKYIGKKSKNIVFCPTIKELNQTVEDSEYWFENFENVKRYIIHTGLSKDDNLKTLKEFNNDNSGVAILFVINLLNEGIHVDNIDNIILNRRTTSPIIYFQQIGRVLSSNQADKEVKIIDLVNNYDSVDDIRQLFSEIEELYNQGIKEHPEMESFYTEKIKKLSLLDATKEKIAAINHIKEQVTREKIIESKIDYAIEQLRDYQKKMNTRLAIYLVKDQKVKSAYKDIYQYSQYVTTRQFQLLQEINMVLPTELSMTLEERVELLNGSESFYLKGLKDREKQIKKLLDFLDYKKPSESSKDPDERSLAQLFDELILNDEKEIVLKLKEKIINYQLTGEEKAFLNFNLTEEEIESVIIEIYSEFKKTNYLSPKRKYTLLNLLNRKSSYDSLIQKILTVVDLKEKEEIDNLSRSDNLQKILKLVTVEKDDYETDNNFMNLYSLLTKREQLEVDKAIRIKRHQHHRIIIRSMKKTYDVIQFMNIFKKLDEDNLNDYYDLIEEEHQTNNILKQYIIFTIKNERVPSNTSENDIEKQLANSILLLSNQNKIDIDELMKMMKEDANEIFQIITKDDSYYEGKKMLCKYALFINKYQRKPVSNSDDIEEIKLFNAYNEYIRIFSESERKHILKRINTNMILRNTIQTKKTNDRKHMAAEYARKH